MTRSIHVSKLAITFFRIIILFFILCILITIILDQFELEPESLHIFNQPDPIQLIPPNPPNNDNSLRTVLNIENNDDKQQNNNEFIIYDPKTYTINDKIELESSRLFIAQNPLQSLYYDYVTWPCSNHMEYKSLTLLPDQNILTHPSVYNINYLNPDNDNGYKRYSLCNKQTILEQDINKYILLIEHTFLYEMWLDKLPIFAPIGFKNDNNYYLYTHRIFQIDYNSDEFIVAANIIFDNDNSDNFIEIYPNNGDIKDIDFTYSYFFNKVNNIERINNWRSHLIVHGFANNNKQYSNVYATYLKGETLNYSNDITDIHIDINALQKSQTETVGDETSEAEYIDPGMMLHPAYLPKKTVNYTVLTVQELERNSDEWKMTDLLPELSDNELDQCGDKTKYYSKLSEDRLRYFDKIQLWPIPQKFILFDKNVFVKSDLKWSCNCGQLIRTNHILSGAIERYNALIFEHRIDMDIENKYLENSEYYFMSVKLVIDDIELSEVIPSENMNEWYEIIIPYDNMDCHTIYIHSKSVFGMLRAIETLSQLIYYDFDMNIYMIKYIGYILDYPYYNYRGVLLDTARHFQPVKFIKHFIDSISYAKYNVFHWHMVDDQSWPFPIYGTYDEFKLEDLYNKGCHSKQERYSLNDIKDIIYYANIRGIRVIPEFDVPGHVGSWCKAFDICLNITCHHSTSGVLDPSKPLTFKIVKAVYDEIIKIFNDTYIHIGNDEANYQCFKNNSNLYQWFIDNDIKNMKVSGIRRRKKADGIKINAFTVLELFKIFEQYQNKILISWDDLYTKARGVIPKDVILMVWQSRWQKDLSKMLKAGYKLIITAPFYVDRWYEPLTDRYFADLWPRKTANLGMEYKNNIIGGEACLWAENVDGSVLDAKLWPDAAATIENLWLGPKKIKTLIPLWEYIIKHRLKWYRCFMMGRDIGFMQIDIDKKYPADEFYLREPLYPFSCMNELDVRPIEQILPPNDTRAARRAARKERQKQRLQERKSQGNSRAVMGDNMKNDLISIGMNEGVDRIKKSGMNLVKWVIGLIFVAVILCILLVCCVSLTRDIKDKSF